MNPIVRMMKWYINMPLKKALPLLFIGAVVLAATAGCTSSSNTASKAPATPTPTPLAADNLAGAINDLYKKENYTLSTPFTMTKQGDTITYHGVIVTTPDSNGQRYTFNVTIVFVSGLTAGGSTADDIYNGMETQLKNKYNPAYITYGSLDTPHSGTYTYASTVSGGYGVYMFYLGGNGAVLAGDSLAPKFFRYLNNADVGNYVEILIVEILKYGQY